MNKQKGFSAVEGLMVVLVVAIVGFGGWYVFYSNDNEEKTEQIYIEPEEWIRFVDEDTKIEYDVLEDWTERKPKDLGARIFSADSRIPVYDNATDPVEFIKYNAETNEWSAWRQWYEIGELTEWPYLNLRPTDDMVSGESIVSTAIYDTTDEGGGRKRSGTIRILFTDDQTVREVSIPSIIGSRLTTDADVNRVIDSIKF